MTTAATVKKRGRPRKMREGGLLHRFPPSPPPPSAGPRRTLRPRRRRPLLNDFADFDDYLDEEEEEVGEEEEEEEMERRGKRRQLKLILKLPPPGPSAARRVEEEAERPHRAAPAERRSFSSSSASSSSYVHDDDEGEEDEAVEPVKPLKKRPFGGCDDGVRSGGSTDRQKGEKNFVPRLKVPVSGVTTSPQAAGTPLPERKLLEAILDKIQKKDTYGVFAEPVDIEELPDYLDVIVHPMDFGTVRKKLASNAYHSFEQFEDDVFLICSNAMQYNAPDTIYFRQARSMQDIGRKEFQKLRTDGKIVATDSKTASEGHRKNHCEEKVKANPIEKKPLQKSLPRVVQESFVSDISSATTLASGGDACTVLSTMEANGAEPATTSNGLADGSSSLGESKSEKVDDLRVKGSPSKLAKKTPEVDENRRATYNIFDQPDATESSMVYDVLEGDQRQLVAVGLDAEYSYARSLARFAGNLGPIAWKIASQRIGSALPSGVKFGCGWVGEYEPLLSPILSLSNSPQKQQEQIDINMKTTTKTTTKQFKMPLKKCKATAAGRRKAGGNDDRKEVNVGNQSQTQNTIYNRDTDLVNEGNDRCGFTGAKQQSSKFISETQIKKDAAALQMKNKQVTFNLAKAGGATLEQARECQPYSSNSRLINPTLQRPHIYDGVAACKSPGTIQLDRKSVESEPRKQAEAILPCSTGDGSVNLGQFTNGKVLGSSVNNSTMEVMSKYQKGFLGNNNLTLVGHEPSFSDPTRLMGLPIKMFGQPNISNSAVDSSKLFPLAGPLSGREKSNTANAVASQAWISVGASSQSKLSVDTVGVHNSQNGLASALFYGSSWGTPNSSPRVSDNSKTTAMPQAFRQPIQVVGLQPQVRDKGLVIFPQLVATDMSRFQSQTLHQGLPSPTENKHNRNICPPDLNISFQPPGSPVRHSSGILQDSQQPDLALQL
ncbi:hypothetical protein Cni_G23940 [Canna indica]|uniref:Bromo domain-containing protein n=1 Tax=Canna indica TaxID=4628 RepID=A0AAQ3KUT3_9LILI|nr:hypothetical protein Cni_G23940 [Canna indica]